MKKESSLKKMKMKRRISICMIMMMTLDVVLISVWICVFFLEDLPIDLICCIVK